MNFYSGLGSPVQSSMQNTHQATKNVFNNNLFYLDNVTVKFGSVTALKSVHLTVAEKEILFVTGPSGAGKTTLMNVLAGHLNPTSGRAILPQNKEKSDFYVTQVFQDIRLLDSLSVEENLWVSYNPLVYQSKNEFRQEMEEFCKILNIWDKIHHRVNQLNGGGKQKLAVVRALLARPQVVLADEPTSSLDRENGLKLFELLTWLNQKRGLTVIWSSHNRELIKQFSGRIIHLENGKLVYSGHACFI